jgi:hypothetical protein
MFFDTYAQNEQGGNPDVATPSGYLRAKRIRGNLQDRDVLWELSRKMHNILFKFTF